MKCSSCLKVSKTLAAFVYSVSLMSPLVVGCTNNYNSGGVQLSSTEILPYNPGGSQFEYDEDFAKKYQKYKSNREKIFNHNAGSDVVNPSNEHVPHNTRQGHDMRQPDYSSLGFRSPWMPGAGCSKNDGRCDNNEGSYGSGDIVNSDGIDLSKMDGAVPIQNHKYDALPNANRAGIDQSYQMNAFGRNGPNGAQHDTESQDFGHQRSESYYNATTDTEMREPEPVDQHYYGQNFQPRKSLRARTRRQAQAASIEESDGTAGINPANEGSYHIALSDAKSVKPHIIRKRNDKTHHGYDHNMNQLSQISETSYQNRKICKNCVHGAKSKIPKAKIRSQYFSRASQKTVLLSIGGSGREILVVSSDMAEKLLRKHMQTNDSRRKANLGNLKHIPSKNSAKRKASTKSHAYSSALGSIKSIAISESQRLTNASHTEGFRVNRVTRANGKTKKYSSEKMTGPKKNPSMFSQVSRFPSVIPKDSEFVIRSSSHTVNTAGYMRHGIKKLSPTNLKGRIITSDAYKRGYNNKNSTLEGFLNNSGSSPAWTQLHNVVDGNLN